MDLYEPTFCYTNKSTNNKRECHPKVFISADRRRIYIYMMNSDGAGAYEVTWIIQDKKYWRRVVDEGY